MSRIGVKPVPVVAGVKVTPSKTDTGTKVDVEGPKGKLAFEFRPEVGIAVDGKAVVVSRMSDDKFSKSYHGTVRSLIQNMVLGVSRGFEKKLEIVGVGYNAKAQGEKLVMNIGFCHPVEFDIPAGLEVETPAPTQIHIRGADKQAVGEFAAVVRRVRPPEPYKGKGIKYHDEVIVRKAGKTFGSGD